MSVVSSTAVDLLPIYRENKTITRNYDVVNVSAFTVPLPRNAKCTSFDISFRLCMKIFLLSDTRVMDMFTFYDNRFRFV